MTTACRILDATVFIEERECAVAVNVISIEQVLDRLSKGLPVYWTSKTRDRRWEPVLVSWKIHEFLDTDGVFGAPYEVPWHEQTVSPISRQTVYEAICNHPTREVQHWILLPLPPRWPLTPVKVRLELDE